ncbi:MAG: glycerol-3-phosphate 1-O-acyltransferase PlsY [Gemmatimonadaceae bacterium]|nr:glycerol-3-phosphate 1-O-acyltransferase PlsY [Gemmatimonadaceae bacterium]
MNAFSGMGVAGLGAAYLLGSTPFAWLAGRVMRGIDLRQHGSGNLGATNVFRTLGAPAAVIVLLLDAAKGAVPTLFFAPIFVPGGSSWWPAAMGVAAILGHVKPYLGMFRGGGKGVATASGVFAALAPGAYGVALTVFLLTVAVTRFVSLGSMIGAVALAAAAAVLYGPSSHQALLSVIIAAMVAWTHRANIGRLRRGEESRLGGKPVQS